MIKALFFDVDGTLVSFNTHKVPESTIEALREAHKRGVKLFTATGRPRQLLNNITEVEDIMDGFILATGAQCVYGEKVVRQDLIPTHEAEAIVDFCNRLDVPVEEVIKQGILQITPFLTEDQERTILPHIPGTTSARWHPAFCDLTSATADKANGIRAIAEHMGIDISETMAFGDGGNDLTMLRAAGVGVAMGNALDEVKAHADYVTSSVDEDGIANALKHFEII